MRFLPTLFSAALIFVAAAPALAQSPAPVPTATAAPATMPATTPQPLDAAMEAAIDTAVTAILAAEHGTAATIAVVEDGTIVYTRGYGVRDLAARLPADAQTRYEIGSITKQFTAAAVLQLKEAGKIDLDAPLAAYLPKAPHAREVTIRQLLTHTSGLHEYLDGTNVVAQAAKPITFDQLIARIAKKPLDFKPGTKWAYSNTNYILLGRVVEAVSHQSYDEYLRRHLFGPAGMTQTGIIADEPALPDMARGYEYVNGKTKAAPPLANSWAWSAGEIVSTVADLEKWNGALASGKIVSAADYALMTTPQLLAGGANSDYGFGLVIDRFEGQPRIWHNGGTFGFNANNQFFPNQGVRIIALTNDAAGPSAAIVARVYNDLFPAIAAAAVKPAAGEDPAVTARVKAFILPALQGHLDRSLITDDASKAVSDQMVAAVASQFAGLGTPTFIYRGTTDRPAGPVYVYLLQYPQARFTLTVQIEKQSNKFSTFFIGP